MNFYLRYLQYGLFLSLISIGIAFISCEKENSVHADSNDFVHLKTDYKDCSDSMLTGYLTKKSAKIQSISPHFRHDTMNLDVSLNYYCCAVFDTKAAVENDTLQLDIIDLTTEFQKSYCYCMCDYNFRFHFKYEAFTSYPCKINLITNENKHGKIMYTGKINSLN